MSNLNQFIGGEGLGELGFYPGMPAKFTDDAGQTWLRTGALTANDSSYNILLGKSNAHGVCVYPGKSIGNDAKGLHWVGNTAYFAIFYTASSPTTFRATTIDGTYSNLAFATITAAYDSAMIGNTLIVAGNSGMNYSSDGTTYTNTTFATINYASCAVNSAGTLAVMYSTQSNTAGYIYTSINGTSWTSRTPTGFGGSSDPISIAGWMPCANAFVCISNSTANPAIHTTADGYTMTQRTMPSGMGNSAGLGYGGKYIASSATATLVSMNNCNIIRTTDGTNWTAISLSNAFGTTSQQLGIAYISGTFYAYGLYGEVAKSTDDGLTWSRHYLLYDSTAGLYSGNLRDVAFMNTVNGAVRAITAAGGSASVMTPTISSPNYIGSPEAKGWAGQSGSSRFTPAHMRIK